MAAPASKKNTKSSSISGTHGTVSTTLADKLTYSTKECASVLGLSVETVRRWIRTGKLKTISFGSKHLIRKETLDNFLKKHEAKQG